MMGYNESKVMLSILLVLLQYVVSEEVMQLRMPGTFNTFLWNILSSCFLHLGFTTGNLFYWLISKPNFESD